MFSLLFVGPWEEGGYAWSHVPSRGLVSRYQVPSGGYQGEGVGIPSGGVNHGEGGEYT